MYFFMPLALVTGPALPDLLLFFFSILSIFVLITKKQKFDIKFESWMIVSIILWVWFVFISFFAINFKSSITDSLIFIRFMLFIFFSYSIFSNISKKILFFFLNSLFLLCILMFPILLIINQNQLNHQNIIQVMLFISIFKSHSINFLLLSFQFYYQKS